MVLEVLLIFDIYTMDVSSTIPYLMRMFLMNSHPLSQPMCDC